MPAITVADLTVLARLSDPGPAARQRPVESVTTAPRGFEGEGFPVFRAFAGVDLTKLDPFIHLDQMGAVDYGPGGLISDGGTQWVAPRYQDLSPEQVVLLSSSDGGALVRVIAGDIDGHPGPGSTYTPMAMVHATVSPGAELALAWPPEFNALVYILAGRGTVGQERRPLHQGQLAVLGSGAAITVAADQAQDGHSPTFEVLLLGGRPIREPVSWAGPFVMNTKAEIQQAFDDFESGGLGQVPAATHAPTHEVVEQIESALD